MVVKSGFGEFVGVIVVVVVVELNEIVCEVGCVDGGRGVVMCCGGFFDVGVGVCVF